MPKLIDYPRTTYAGAWELAEVVDDTGGKCEIETAARKLNRKVSGSFKAIIGSAVKFGLLTSKRELLSVTTLYKRIKHAYDKKEELLFHREAFLTPPLFTQICRKFRLRELPVQMLDVMLIREFGVEEINAQGVAKAFVEGCRMVNLLDERNTMADIDAASALQPPRRELAAPTLGQSSFNPQPPAPVAKQAPLDEERLGSTNPAENSSHIPRQVQSIQVPTRRPTTDAVANLFGLFKDAEQVEQHAYDEPTSTNVEENSPTVHTGGPVLEQETQHPEAIPRQHFAATPPSAFQLQISGPGLNSVLSILEEEDLLIAQALLEKIRRQLKAQNL